MPGAVVTAMVVMVVVVREGEAMFGIPDFLGIGGCPNVTLKKDFDPVKYTGTWFDIESVPNEYLYPKKCITENYTWTGEYMNVATQGLTAEDRKVRQWAVMHKELDAIDTPQPAYMTVTSEGVPSVPYEILETDYRTYACVYSCLEYFGFRAEFTWVFSRTPSLPPATRARCHATLRAIGVDPDNMFPIIQGETCPYSDRLEEMLSESERYLLKVLGPYVPTTSTTTTSTTTTTTTPQPATQDEAIQKIESRAGRLDKDHTRGGQGDGSPDSDRDSSSSSRPTPGPLWFPLLLLPFLLLPLTETNQGRRKMVVVGSVGEMV